MTRAERTWDNDAAISAFEDAVAYGRLAGYAPEDPFVGALAWLLEGVERPLTARQIFQAIPHAPRALSAEDLRNTLWNLGQDAEIVRISRGVWRRAEGSHLVFDHKGRPFVRSGPKSTPMDPVSGENARRSPRAYAFLLRLTSPREEPTGAWTGRQVRFMRRELLQLMAVKAVLVCVSLAIALGVVAVYQWVLSTGSMNTLIALAAGLVAVLVSDFGFRGLKARIMGEIAERAEHVLAIALVERVLHMPLEKIAMATPAQQSARLRQLMSASSIFSGPALDVVLDLPFALLLLAGVALIAPPLALVPLCLAAVLCAMGLLALPELRRREAAASEARAVAGRLVDEVVQNRRQIQADGREALMLRRSVGAARDAAVALQRYERLQRGLEALSSASGPLAGGLLAIVGAILVMQGSIGIGVLLGVMILSWRILAPIQSGSQVILKLAELLERRRAIDALMTAEQESGPGTSPLKGINGRSLATDGLVCRYPGAGDAALKGVTVNIPQNALVAVTGASGAGKTTLLRAMAGLMPARAGRVMVGGLNTEQIPVGMLRRSVVFVPARPHILHGTVSQNLRLCSPGASDAWMRTVCEDLDILDAIEALPRGFETRITTQTSEGLPTGFLQSLAIARAIMVAPHALLLDEPAVGLDARLEAGLLRTLEKGRGAHTILMVTHRPSHVRFCGYELRIEHGQLRHFQEPDRSAA